MNNHIQRRRKFILLSISILFLCISNTYTKILAQTSRDSLNQSVQQLQSTTGDAYFTLLEKIIAISNRVKPLPAIPETANEKYVTALTLREDASSKNDFERPISLLKEARTLAPWWPDIYKELGITFELAAVYDTAYYASAIANFQWALKTLSDSEEARKIQNEIYILKAKKEKAIQKLYEEKEKADQQEIISLVGEWRSTNKTFWDYISIEKLASGSYKVRWVYGTSDDIKIGNGEDSKIEVKDDDKVIVFELSSDGRKCIYNFKSQNDRNITELIRR